MSRRVLLVLATSTGGTGRHVASLAGEMIALGWQVQVAGPAATGARFGFAGLGAVFSPVEIESGPHPVRDARALRQLRRLAAPVDVVHAHGLRAGLLAGAATRRGAPYVVTRHNAVLGSGPVRAVATMLDRVVAHRAAVTLCVSKDLQDRVRALGGRDVRLGPVAAAPLEAPTRAPAAVREDLGAEGRPLLLSIGRLHPQKGYRTLVEAAARLSIRDNPPLFVVAGDGPQRAELTGLIAHSGAPVRLLGDRDDVPDLLAAADLVVLPSGWEGSPLAAQEALLAGRPLVTTAAGGTPDLVGDGALLVPPGDPAALAEALVLLLDDPALRAALAGRGQRVGARLPTERAVAARIAAVYVELLEAADT